MPPGNIISPFVSDLSKLSHGKEFSVCSGGTCVIRCALLNTACDLPAGRRACGFFSFSANLGCSRGYHNFGTSIFLRKQNYSGFDQHGNFAQMYGTDVVLKLYWSVLLNLNVKRKKVS